MKQSDFLLLERRAAQTFSVWKMERDSIYKMYCIFSPKKKFFYLWLLRGGTVSMLFQKLLSLTFRLRCLCCCCKFVVESAIWCRCIRCAHTFCWTLYIWFGLVWFSVVEFCIFFSLLLLYVRAHTLILILLADAISFWFWMDFIIICNALLVVTKISKYLFALYYLCMIAYFSFSIFSYFLGVFVVVGIIMVISV